MPDAAGNIRGIALNGKAGETLDRIFKRELEAIQRYGYVHCWKTVEGKPGNCRKPEGHEGECAPF